MAPETTTMPKSDFLAQPCRGCCIQGSIHEGKAKGSFETNAGYSTYVATPAADKANGNVLLFFADIVGMSNNSLLLLDAWAEAGYLGLGVDFFPDDHVSNYVDDKTKRPIVEGWDLMEWAVARKELADKVAPRWAAAVKEKYSQNGTRFACVGYCFGSTFVFDMLKTGICEVGAVAHPTFLTEKHFEDVTRPLFLSCCENDSLFGPEARRKAVDIMMKTKTRYQVQLFQGVDHGFATRANLSDPYQKWVKEQSFNCIVAFVDFWLSAKSNMIPLIDDKVADLPLF